MRRRKHRRRKPSRNRAQRARKNSYMLFDLFGYDDLSDYDEMDFIFEAPAQQYKSTPIQNVYFFKRGMNTFIVMFIPKSCCFNRREN